MQKVRIKLSCIKFKGDREDRSDCCYAAAGPAHPASPLRRPLMGSSGSAGAPIPSLGGVVTSHHYTLGIATEAQDTCIF